MNLINLYQDVISWNDFVGNKINNKELSNLYIDLVKEETQEIFDSIENVDAAEFLDGICDTLVVGSFLLALKRQRDFSDYEISKQHVDFKESIFKLRKLVQYNTYENIEEIIILVENISYSLDLDIEKSFEEVMISNWSKFPLIENVTPLNEIKYIESKGRYKEVRFEKNIDSKSLDRYIFKDGNGKVVKPSTFKEPKLSQFIPESFVIFKS
jgi:NTP pyrophosphatase (non-canonical NTP hydrolase)